MLAAVPRINRHILEIIRGASVAFGGRVLGAGLAFLLHLVLARLLGASGTGVFYLGTMVLMCATVIGRFGLDNAVLRYVATYASSREWSRVKGVYKGSVFLVLGASALTALAMFASAPWISRQLFKAAELTPVLRWMSAAVVPMSLLAIHAEALKGLKRVGWATLLQTHGGVLIPAFALIGIALAGSRLDATRATSIYVAAVIGVALVAFLAWKRESAGHQPFPSTVALDELLRSSLPLFGVAAAHIVMSFVSIFFLGIFRGAAEVGVFGVTARIAALTGFFLFAVNSIAAPKFAALHNQCKMQELKATVQESTVLMIAAASPLLLIFLLAPGFVLSMFGHEFVTEGRMPLRILALGQFANVATGSVGYLLMMTGHERSVRNVVCASAAASIVLNLMFVVAWGLVGAAIASGLSLALMNTGLVVAAIRRLHISTLPTVWTIRNEIS